MHQNFSASYYLVNKSISPGQVLDNKRNAILNPLEPLMPLLVNTRGTPLVEETP